MGSASAKWIAPVAPGKHILRHRLLSTEYGYGDLCAGQSWRRRHRVDQGQRDGRRSLWMALIDDAVVSKAEKVLGAAARTQLVGV
jgi:hypothetical protein